MAAELLTRIWLPEIQKQLFSSQLFMSRARNDDAYVTANTVELAHAGTIPATVVDRVILPGQIQMRTDVATNYQLQEFSTDPTRLGYSEELVISYPKRQSILQQHMDSIDQTAGDYALYRWAVGAGVFGTSLRVIKSTGKTDGGAAATRTATGPSQTGTRNQFGKDDLVKIRQMFFKDNVVYNNVNPNLVAVLTAEQYGDLIGLPNVAEAQKYGRATFPDGVVDRILGFDIYVRNRVLVYDNSDALKTVGAAAVATDQDAAIFYAPDFVRRAKGAVVPFVQLKSPTHYGDIFSMAVRFGAAPTRNDNKGIVVMMEDNG